MNQTPRHQDTRKRLVFRGNARQTSLFRFFFSLFLGGIPLIVYYTQPGAPIAALAAALAAGLPPYLLALWTLADRRALLVDPETRRFAVVRRGGRCIHGFDEAFACTVLGDELDPRDAYELNLVFKSGRVMLLGEGSYDDLEGARRRITGALGLD